ncbi:14-3-3-like protein 2 [Pecten maximus]|uniref:14-3-3-like protein 2 n=1 Tax=Pecten maximus TaxID=6579 RepID=UPI0014590064|nr:14-3-3-like protein 2 [Pecten maximus]
MSSDRRSDRRPRQDEKRNDSDDRDKEDDHSNRRSDPSNDGPSRRSGRNSGRSNDRKSSRDDEQSSREDRKSSRDDEQSSRDDRKPSRNEGQSSRNGRKSSRDDDQPSRSGRKSSRADEQSRKEDRKSKMEGENNGEDRKSKSSHGDNDNKKTDRDMDEMIETNSVLAEIAEQTCRYGDCLMFLSEVIHARKCLSDKQRDMFWSSFRNQTSSKRNSWRKSLELERNSDKKEKEASAAEYRNKLSKKIVTNCKSVLTLIDDYLIPYLDDSSGHNEKSDIVARIFYLKVKADSNRYMWEITEDKQDRKRYENEADKSYERAYDKAVREIGPAIPLRLGLALNYSVLQYEVLENKDKARSLAMKAADDAEPEVDKLDKDDKMASESIIASLEHNIHLWKHPKD